ncbi:hypothetical protein E1B28_011879 [Marasmius oreades]|uniref:Uncharacterized protein n=1 Tax=Marasmius oreades TaxID=181124 RepID=A0A9P7RV03_9AGAR|nr:uncharacterized protein E1B28_011879 [Marasmius oreades]KAG7090281.1 hypothetical protein E1B28_011879 [Marasmius oreades]
MEFSEEEMDWASGDVDSDDEMDMDIDLDENEQERIMDIDVVGEVGAEKGVYMEFSLPPQTQTQTGVELGAPPAPSAVPGPSSSTSPTSLLSPQMMPKLEGIRLPELRMRDMDQFKAVFDMDAPAPPASSFVEYDGDSSIMTPLSLTHSDSSSPSASPSPSPTSTRKLHYYSRRFGSIASGTPVNPVTRRMWATGDGFSSVHLGLGLAPSTFESGGSMGSFMFGGGSGGSDSGASISEGVHWGVLRRREPRPNHDSMMMTAEWQAGLFSNFADIVGSAGESSGSDVGIGGGSPSLPNVPIDPVLQATDGYMGMAGMGLYEGGGMGVGGGLAGTTVGGFTFPSEQPSSSANPSTNATPSTPSGSTSSAPSTSSNTPQDFSTWGENPMVDVSTNTSTGDINMGFSMSFNPMGFPVSPNSLTTISTSNDSNHHPIISNNQPSLTSSSTCSLGSVMSPHQHHQQMNQLTSMEELRNQSSQSPSPPLGYVTA